MLRSRKSSRCPLLRVALSLLFLLSWGRGALGQESPPRPNILVISVDTLRTDRMSVYGYDRETSPHIDALLERGARFVEARTVQTVTAPAMCSFWTGLYPHEHGTTRNSLVMREGLESVSGVLARRGYHTAGFVSNWFLKDRLSGLGDHFDHYEGIFTRKQWIIVRKEATAEDVTDAALGWVEKYLSSDTVRPFLLWAHYMEPHAPYRYHQEYAERLGLNGVRNETPEDRYDTEIASVDKEIGRLLGKMDESLSLDEILVVFVADHGESLGEHGIWGHGKNVYEESLHIPLGIVWPARIAPRTIDAPASLIDVPSTLLGLLELPVPDQFRGFDWSGVLDGGAPDPGRVTFHQAHKGTIVIKKNLSKKRRRGLLEVAIVRDGKKEIFDVKKGVRHLYDLTADRDEEHDLAESNKDLSATLLEWMGAVYAGLDALDRLPVGDLREEDVEKLRTLGYLD